jgi:hypothetical protein
MGTDETQISNCAATGAHGARLCGGKGAPAAAAPNVAMRSVFDAAAKTHRMAAFFWKRPETLPECCDPVADLLQIC